MAAKEVWLTRSVRSDDAETVVSRWLNRVQNLLSGLPDQGGAAALQAMRVRGQAWLDQVTALESPEAVPRAPRPAPAPPVAARPAHLSVTEIKRLIRDPYAIYARHVLRLRPLDPLMKVPDALLRGTVLHEVLERFVKQSCDDPGQGTRAALLAVAEDVLAQHVPWAEARALWLARLDRVADWFIETEGDRRASQIRYEFELRGRAEIPELGFALSAKADRLDLDAHGRLCIYDYKTGTPPTGKEQTSFDKQLLLMAAMAERGAFEGLGPGAGARAMFIGLGGTPKEVDAPLDDEPPDQVWAEFKELIACLSGAREGLCRAPRAAHIRRARRLRPAIAVPRMGHDRPARRDGVGQ